MEKPPCVENLMQKLEEACTRGGGRDLVSEPPRDTPGTSSYSPGTPGYVPARIREIVDECLSPTKSERPAWNASPTSPRSNGVLQNELRRAQDILEQSRRDCKTFSSKYAALKLIASLEDKIADLIIENRKLADEKTSMQCKLAEQEERHALHLRAYQEGQEKHSKLILKLQNKVLQYKDACGELQQKFEHEQGTFKRESSEYQATIKTLNDDVKELKQLLHTTREANSGAVKSLITEAEGQEERANQLFASNNKLRRQLEEMNEMNQRLSEDVHQLTAGWNEAQNQLKEKDEMWLKMVEDKRLQLQQSHQNSLKALLADAANMKEAFNRIKSATVRNLDLMKGELFVTSEHIILRAGQSSVSHCTIEDKLSKALQQKEQCYAKVNSELNGLKCSTGALKIQYKLDMEEWEKRLRESTVSLNQAEQTKTEQAKLIDELKSKIADMESCNNTLDYELTSTKAAASALKDDCETLKGALDEIVQLFIVPDDTPLTPTCHCFQNSPKRLPLQSPSPTHRLHSSQLTAPPAMFDCHGDAVRLKDWSVSMVKHGIDTTERDVKNFKQELSTMAQAIKDKQERIRLLEEEIKAHSNTTGVMRSDLASCHANLHDLNRVKLKLEHQLEEANIQKQQVERKLVQASSRLDSMMEENSKKEATNASLEDAILALKDELKILSSEKESVESSLSTKDSENQHLSLQLKMNEGEVTKLRARMSDLEHLKLNLERDVNHAKTLATELQLEKEGLQRDLRAVKESEHSILVTLEELRVTNGKLEAEKRLLTQSLQETTSIKDKLDLENSKLEQARFACSEQIEGLLDTSHHLNEQIAQLDKSLVESNASRYALQLERDKLYSDVAELTDVLDKSKEAISELQVQKGKLSSIIAKLTGEKGDAMQEKAALEKELAQTLQSLHMAEEKAKSLKANKESLEQRVDELERKLALAEQNVFRLQESNFLLKQEKHDVEVEKERVEQQKEHAISQLQNEKALELQQVLVRARSQENDLQAAIAQLQSSTDKRLKEMEECHAQKLVATTLEHEKVVSNLQGLIESMKQAHKEEVFHVGHIKDQQLARAEKDKKCTQDQLSQLQASYSEATERSHDQQAQMTSTITGLKVQLQTAQNAISKLEKELSVSEHQINTLQAKLEEVRCVTDEQLDILRSQLRTANETLVSMECSQDELHMTVKQLETKRETLREQLDGAHKQIQLTSDEREQLRSECQRLKQNQCTLQEELARSKAAATGLTESLAKSDESRCQAERDIKAYCGSLLTLENTHARLAAEYAAVQAALTSSERKTTALQLQLREVQERADRAEETNSQASEKVLALEDRLKALSRANRKLEDDNEGYRRRVENLESEEREQMLATARAQDELKADNEERVAASLQLKAELEACQKRYGQLQDTMAELELDLERSENKCADLDSKLRACESLVRRQQEEQADMEMLSGLFQERYFELVGVLNGTLDLGLESSARDFKRAIDDAAAAGADTSGYLSEGGLDTSTGSSTARRSPLAGLHAGKAGAASVRVRDAILALRKQLMEARNERHDAAAALHLTEKKVRMLEEEKGLLETQMKAVKAASANFQLTAESLKKKLTETEADRATQAGTLQEMEARCRELQTEVDGLQVRLSEEKTARETREARFKQLSRARTDDEADRTALAVQLSEAQVTRQLFQQETERLQSEVSVLKSLSAAKEAEMTQLATKHEETRKRLAETEQQLSVARENALVLDRSLSEITRKEAELVHKTHHLELQLGRLRVDRLQLEEKVMRHEEETTRTKRDKDAIEAQLYQIVGNADGKVAARVLKADSLERSASDGELKTLAMNTRLKHLESQLEMEHKGKIKAQASFDDAQMEKKSLEVRLKSLEATLESTTKNTLASQQLSASLEKETLHLKAELQRIRKDNGKMKGEMEALQSQLQLKSNIGSPLEQQEHVSRLNQRLASATQQNTSLLQTVKNLKASLDSKDEEYQQRLECMRKETEKLNHAHKTLEGLWQDKEQEYKKSINQLEKKMQGLETKMEKVRQKRAEYAERAREHEGSICEAGVHLATGHTGRLYSEAATTNDLGVAPVRLSAEAMKLKQSTMELLQSTAPFFAAPRAILTSTPVKKA